MARFTDSNVPAAALAPYLEPGEQQKNARGSNVCVMAEFDSHSNAEGYAERRGGKGADVAAASGA